MLLLRFILIVIVYVIMFVNSEAARIFCIFPAPILSHQKYFGIAANAMAMSGNNVTIQTSMPEVFEKQEFKENNISMLSNDEINTEIVNECENIKEVFFSVNRIQRHYLMHKVQDFIFNKVMRLVKSHELSHSYDVVILEAGIDPFLVIPFKWKVPVIILSSVPPHAYMRYFGHTAHPIYYPEANWAIGDTTTIWGKIQKVYLSFTEDIGEWHLTKLKDMLFEEINGVTPNLYDLRNNVDLLFVNANEFWDGNRPVPPGFVLIEELKQDGPEDISEDLKSFLDNSSNGFIYMSFGTTFNTNSIMSEESMKIFQGAFEKLNYDVVWKWDSDHMERKPSNVRIERWLPQKYILDHPKLKLFITHAGAHSTSESIEAGVPMVAVPLFGDQFYNAQRIQLHNIGKQLDFTALTENELLEAVTEVIGNRSYHRNSQRLRNLWNDKPHSAKDKFVWWSEYVIRHKGADHLRSSAKNVSLYDYLVLDLVLTLLGCLFVLSVGVVALIFLLTKKLSIYSRRKEGLQLYSKRL